VGIMGVKSGHERAEEKSAVEAKKKETNK